jgi:hypothetical protein
MENVYKLEDYKKLLFELFSNANEKKCNLTTEFINNNIDLFKKTVAKNNYGIPQGSTALHILAKKDFGATINTLYRTQTFLRDINNDINTIINCLYKNLDNEDMILNLRKIKIINKKDKNGKTVMDIINENMEDSSESEKEKYAKLKTIIEKINGEPIKEDSVKSDSTKVKSAKKVKDVIKIEIDTDAILEETTKNKKKTIRINNSNKEKKPYRVLIVKRKTLKSPLKSLIKSLRKSLKNQ